MPQLYVADDNTDFAEFIATVARDEGWVAQTCVNGRELWEKLSSGTGPALLIVDVNMPEVDGIEAIEGLVDLERPLRIRFITGGTIPPVLAAGMIAKARDLVVGPSIFKPLSKSDLVSLLHAEKEALSTL